MEKRSLDIIIGSSLGGTLITGTDAVAGAWSAIVVNEDCVFNALLVDGVDVMTARGFTGKTITAGMFIGVGLNQSSAGYSKFTSIDLVSGSVMAY